MVNENIKLCECGCGNPAPIAKYDFPERGWIKGQSKRFINGHNRPFLCGSSNPSFNHGFTFDKDDRAYISCYGGKTFVKWVRIVYQNYFLNGKEIPDGYNVHHIDENPSNDAIYNLQLLTHGEHVILHHLGKMINGKAIVLIKDCAIMEFMSAKEASRALNLSDSAVGNAIRGGWKVKGWIASYL